MKKKHLFIVVVTFLIVGCKKSTPVCLPCYYMDRFIHIDSLSGDSVFTLSNPPHKSPYTDCYDTITYKPTGPFNLPLGYEAQLNSDTLYFMNISLPGWTIPNAEHILYCR